MTITEMIVRLETIREQYGDVRVTLFDEYREAEGFDYRREELWLDTDAVVETVENDDGEQLETVVVFR